LYLLRDPAVSCSVALFWTRPIMAVRFTETRLPWSLLETNSKPEWLHALIRCYPVILSMRFRSGLFRSVMEKKRFLIYFAENLSTAFLMCPPISSNA